MLPIAPLMHGATQWGVMGGAFVGNKIVLVAKFEPRRRVELVAREKVNAMMITGDAMARPLLEALDEPGVADLDLSSRFSLSSTAALFSPSVKDQFLERFPNLILTEAIGSSEGGSNGYTMVEKGNTAMKGGPTVNADPRQRRARREPRDRAAGLGRHRQGRAARQHPARVLQGPGEDAPRPS